jgi:hypothetical protein
MSELLEKVQKDGVGKYATEMMEYFKMLHEKARIWPLRAGFEVWNK